MKIRIYSTIALIIIIIIISLFPPLFSSNLVPKSIVVPYYGITPPTGWLLCDGKNNTPNLTDKFIFGGLNKPVRDKANIPVGISSLSTHYKQLGFEFSSRNSDFPEDINTSDTKQGTQSGSTSYTNNGVKLASNWKERNENGVYTDITSTNLKKTDCAHNIYNKYGFSNIYIPEVLDHLTDMWSYNKSHSPASCDLNNRKSSCVGFWELNNNDYDPYLEHIIPYRINNMIDSEKRLIYDVNSNINKKYVYLDYIVGTGSDGGCSASKCKFNIEDLEYYKNDNANTIYDMWETKTPGEKNKYLRNIDTNIFQANRWNKTAKGTGIFKETCDDNYVLGDGIDNNCTVNCMDTGKYHNLPSFYALTYIIKM